jgi:hypothetical protein
VRRHDLDFVSLLAGAMFALIAVAYLVAELSDAALDAEWVLPGMLVGLGLLGLVATFWGGRSRAEPDMPGAGNGSSDGSGDRVIPANEEATTEPIPDGEPEPLTDTIVERVDDPGGDAERRE